MKISFRVFAVFLILWLIMAQSCMKMRISDSRAKENFKKAGVVLTTVTVPVGNRHIHYAKTGNDTFPTIVFVHGSPGEWGAFAQYMEDKDLLAKFRMISIDRPGFGYSDYGNAEHMDKQAALIEPVLKQLQNGKPMYLAGHSLGGPMIVWLAGDNPAMYDGLVLLAASVDPAEEKTEGWRGVLDNTPLQFFVPGALRPSNTELKYFKKDVYALQQKFPLIKCKVFIVHGMKDTFVPVGNAAYAEKKLINAASVETTLIPDANHFIPWMKYDVIKKVLLKLY
ncbi:MAG: alpha/beta hydrolase [Sphingobacteriales bacterium]|nr:alpha/beta hydrolase [Sphingobacteriales bacterium]